MSNISLSRYCMPSEFVSLGAIKIFTKLKGEQSLSPLLPFKSFYIVTYKLHSYRWQLQYVTNSLWDNKMLSALSDCVMRSISFTHSSWKCSLDLPGFMMNILVFPVACGSNNDRILELYSAAILGLTRARSVVHVICTVLPRRSYKKINMIWQNNVNPLVSVEEFKWFAIHSMIQMPAW